MIIILCTILVTSVISMVNTNIMIDIKSVLRVR